MHRFFINPEAIVRDMVEITGNDFNHISHSLRLQPGDIIVACPGDGYDLVVELEEFKEDAVSGRILEKKKNISEPEVKVTVAQGIPKKNNMDLIVQKVTELGVNKIIPLITERTIVKLEGKKAEKRIERWQKIAAEAAKQSQRGIIPIVEKLHKLDEFVHIKDEYDLILIFWEGEYRHNIKDVIREQHNKNNINKILTIIGPEGGLAEREIELLKEKSDAVSLTMGKRILRTETAGIVGPAIILYELGELGELGG